MKKFTLTVSILTLFLLPAIAVAEKKVFVSIAPIHSLVQSVLGKSGTATLIIKATASPHGYQLKPSQMIGLQSAHIIFTISPDFETTVSKAVRALKLEERTLSLIGAKGIELLANRKGGAWENDHHHAHEADEADEPAVVVPDNTDPHIWLDPHNAIAMVREIAARLSLIYPDEKSIFEGNSELLIRDVESLNADVAQVLTKASEKPYIVFHDAFQYFEAHYGLNVVGGIAIDPNKKPSISRMNSIREQIQKTGAVCAFREPQFSGKLVEVALRGSSARQGTLDPIGQDIPLGPKHYRLLLTQMATQINSCLINDKKS
ncbi:MAG: zinc ABC transporter substrate-binding protein [Sneathiella sp.]